MRRGRQRGGYWVWARKMFFLILSPLSCKLKLVHISNTFHNFMRTIDCIERLLSLKKQGKIADSMNIVELYLLLQQFGIMPDHFVRAKAVLSDPDLQLIEETGKEYDALVSIREPDSAQCWVISMLADAELILGVFFCSCFTAY